MPHPPSMLVEQFHRPIVAPQTIVLEMASEELLAHRPVLLLKWHMAVASARLRDRLHCPAQPFPHGTPFHHPISPARLPPVVGEAQKVKGVVVFAPRGSCLWGLKRHQPGLLRMDG